jgi:hypothetical protein
MAAGVIENGTVGSVTVAVACALGLTVLVAVTITEAPSTVDGAVYNPALSMVPRPATLHVTVWSVCPDTVAVNARVSPRCKVAVGGETTTFVGGGGGGGGGCLVAGVDVDPQPASIKVTANPVTNSARRLGSKNSLSNCW